MNDSIKQHQLVNNNLIGKELIMNISLTLKFKRIVFGLVLVTNVTIAGHQLNDVGDSDGNLMLVHSLGE